MFNEKILNTENAKYNTSNPQYLGSLEMGLLITSSFPFCAYTVQSICKKMRSFACSIRYST